MYLVPVGCYLFCKSKVAWMTKVCFVLFFFNILISRVFYISERITSFLVDPVFHETCYQHVVFLEVDSCLSCCNGLECLKYINYVFSERHFLFIFFHRDTVMWSCQ